jgi:Subtilase family
MNRFFAVTLLVFSAIEVAGAQVKEPAKDEIVEQETAASDDKNSDTSTKSGSQVTTPGAGGQGGVRSQVQDALDTMGANPDPNVSKQLDAMRNAEQKLETLRKTDQDAKQSQAPNGASSTQANAPAYPPKSVPTGTKNGTTPAGNQRVTYADKSGYKDRWYYELTSAVAIEVFRSMLDKGLPPAPEAKPISTRSKGPPQRIKDEVVVVSESVAAAEALEYQLGAHKLTLKRRETLANLGIVTSVYQVPAMASVPDIVSLLRKEYPGVWIDENNIYRFMDGTVFYPKQKIRWPTLEAGRCTDNMKIGLVDTGVDLTHPALVGQNIVVRPFARAGSEVTPEDHGTALAILLAGSPVYPEFAGLLPNAALYVAEAFSAADAKRGSNFSTTESVVRALDWLVGEDARVINLSFGGPRNLVVELVIYKLLNRGFSIIAAAGNGGSEGPPMYPAAQNGVLAVTAIDQRNSLYQSATRGAYIDFAAPGVDIYTGVVVDANVSYGGRYRSGTSYAAPFVTGIVAMLQSNGSDAYRFLADNAIDLGEAGKDDQFGWGLVQVPFTCS